MSGPKCASYRIDSTVLLEAQRASAAQTARDAQLDRAEALDLAWAARRRTGSTIALRRRLAEQPPDTDTAALEAWNRRTEEALTRAEAELAELELGEHKENLRRRIGAVSSGSTAERIRRRAAEATSGDAAHKRDAQAPPSRPVIADTDQSAGVDRQAELAALVDRMPEGATPQESAALDRAIRRLAESTETEFGSRLITAKAQMQQVERNIAARAESRQRAEALLRTLDGFDGTEIDEARTLLQRVIAGETPLLDSDIERVAQARTTAAAEFERRLVAARIEEALRDAGIEVGPAFATDVVTRDRAYAAARSSQEHAVEVRLRDGLLDMRLVRAAGAPDARLDTEAETEFCKDVGRVSAALHDQGVDLELISHQPPGAVSVEVVPDAQPALDTQARRHTKPNERKRQR